MITYLAHMVWTGCMLDAVKSLFTSTYSSQMYVLLNDHTIGNV